MIPLEFRRPAAPNAAARRALLAVVLAGGAAFGMACHTPYRYAYENKTGVGLTDRANDYCQRAAIRQGYKVVEFGPTIVESPTAVDVRMDVKDGGNALIVSCSFDDAKRIAAIPRYERGGDGHAGYMKSDAKQARDVCDRAVRAAGYDARKTSTAEWNGGRQYRVNVSVRQGGVDRIVGCRFDGVAGTAVVPPVTK